MAITKRPSFRMPVLVLGIGLLCMVGTPLTKAADTKVAATRSARQVYENKKQHLRFEVPENWNITKEVSNERVPLGVVMTVNGTTKVSTVLTVADATDDSTALTVLYAGYMAKYAKSYAHFKAGDPSSVKVAGQPATHVEATCDGKDEPVQMDLFFVVHGGKAYAFSCTATSSEYEAARKSFEELMGSVSWIEQ